MGSKNKSRKKTLNENIMSKYNFAPPKPVNPGRNDLIKYFFKELDSMGTNMSNNNNISNLTNLNIFKSHNNKKNRNFNKTNNSSLAGNIKELTKDKKNNMNIYYTKYREKHSAPENNLQEINRADLPQIKNLSNRHIKITTHYSKSLLSSINENPNIKTNIEMKTGYNKMKRQLKGSFNNNVIDNPKGITGYQFDFNVQTFFNDENIKNMNKKNHINFNNNKRSLIKKESLKNNYNNSNNANNNINLTHSSQRSQIDIAKKNKIINGIKLKLPNVIKKIDIQNALPKTKPKNKVIKNLNRLEEGNKNLSSSSSNILYKKEKTITKIDNNIQLIPPEKKQNEEIVENNIKEKETKKDNIINDKVENEIKKEENFEENKKENINNNNNNNNKNNNIDENNIMNINIEEKNTEPLISKENKEDKNESIEKPNNIISEPIFNPNPNFNLTNNDNNTDKNLTTINKEIKEKEKENPIIKPPTKEIITNQKVEQNEKTQKDLIRENEENLEDMIYESLRLNRSFSENKTDNIYLFDLEFMCRCLGLCLSILIETSKESPHITEINLEALSASEIKYFFFNDVFNENINFLFDLFDKEVNTNINMEQISPLDKLESFLASNNNENINFDINYLKHIRKEEDEPLIKAEEEKEKLKENEENQKLNNLNPNQNMALINGFKIRTGFGEIERDIRFIDEFFSINNRKKKKAKNYNFISDKSKNILCKELSYINEIDSELNGTNSNINNTNLNNNSNNNLNEKNFKEENESNLMDNEDIKEIKEIQNNNVEEDNNNTFNNEMNELGITAENNDDNINKNNNIITKNMSNNSISIKAEEGTERKQEDTINLNDDNKNNSGTIFSEDNNIIEKVNSDRENNELKSIPSEININNNDQKLNDNDKNNQINNEKSLETKTNSEENTNKQEKSNNIEKDNSTEQKSNNQNELKKEKQSQEEDNLNESNYILDIASIDELTYYLIKRAEIFDEDFNYVFMKISERRYIPTPEPQTIFDFMADIIILTKMEKEVVVLSLIYIERLIFNTGLLLTSRNWRRIVLTSMIIASKIWDDNSFENGHFSQVFANLGINEINTLERIFLELINYKVFVKQSEYFKYLMMIKIIALKYNYNGREIVKTSLIKNIKFQEFNDAMQNRMRKKVTLNNSAQF